MNCPLYEKVIENTNIFIREKEAKEEKARLRERELNKELAEDKEQLRNTIVNEIAGARMIDEDMNGFKIQFRSDLELTNSFVDSIAKEIFKIGL